MTARKALGKGLDALIPQTEKAAAKPSTIPLKDIDVNPEQPRVTIDKASLKELVASIKENGVIQAILVRPKGKGYELVAGERRLRAAKIAGLREIPADIREIPDDMLLTLALVENLLREDLNAIEEAKAYRKLADDQGLTHAKIAKAVGKSRSEITNKLRLLDLPPGVRKMMVEGRISAGHARALATIESDDEILRFAREIVKSGLSVRDVEFMIQDMTGDNRQKPAKKRSKLKTEKDPYIADIEKRLEDSLATKVRMAGGNDAGRIVVNYYSPEDLQRILKLLGVDE